MNPEITIFDCETGETVVRPMTDDEHAISLEAVRPITPEEAIPE